MFFPGTNNHDNLAHQVVRLPGPGFHVKHYLFIRHANQGFYSLSRLTLIQTEIH